MRILMARFGTICLLWLMGAGLSFAQNPYYDHGTFPATGTLGTSAGMRAELDLIEAGFAKLPTLSGNANKIIVVNPGATALTATDAPIPSGTSFPASPSTHALYWITNDSTAGECDAGGGSAVTLCRWDGANWVTASAGGGLTGWPTDSTTKEVTWASSFAAAALFGNGTNKWALYNDPTDGLQFICVIAGVANDCNYIRKLASGKYWQVTDSSGNNILKLDPGGATPKDKYTIGSSGNYPLKSVFLSAYALQGDGTNCPARPTVVTISNMIYPTFICTENNSSRLKFSIPMRPNWDGGVVYFKPVYSQTAADTGSVLLDAAAACRALGTAFNGTYGTEVNIDDAVLAGSGAIEGTLSAAITPNGTCAAGDWLFGYLDVDATTNPTTAAATLNFIGVEIFWSETSLSH